MKWLALLLFAASWAAGCAEAQGLTLSPVLIQAPPEGGAASLTLTSGLAAPKMVQVRVFDWSQNDGGEHLVPAEGVRFGPEIFEIAPGKSQVVRFELPDTGGTGNWKVVVDELPSAAGAESGGPAQLSLRLRYVLSMFSGPAGAPGQLQAIADGTGITLSNPGPGWLKLHALSLLSSDGLLQPSGTGIVYLLAGSKVRLPSDADPESYASLEYSVSQQKYAVDLRRAQ